MTRVYKVTVTVPEDEQDYNYQVTIERKGDTIGVIDDHMLNTSQRIGSIIMLDVEEGN